MLCLLSRPDDRSLEAARFLLRLGTPPDIVSGAVRKNMTWLMCAAKYGNLALVRLLLEGGADWRLTDDDSLSAEDYSLSEDRHDVSSYLSAHRERFEFEPFLDEGKPRNLRLLKRI